MLLRRLSPQAKDLCGKLSTDDNITLSPAVGGRKKRNGESGQLQRQEPQKQIGRTSQGKTACFPLWREAEQEADANHPFPRNAALSRLRFTEVANHGVRAVIDSELLIRKLRGVA